MGLTVKDPNVVDAGFGTDGICQVVLYNDNVNDMVHVVDSLIMVFGHNVGIATKVMMEAHEKGRAVAEVEEAEKAIVHKAQLTARKLTADVERI